MDLSNWEAGHNHKVWKAIASGARLALCHSPGFYSFSLLWQPTRAHFVISVQLSTKSCARMRVCTHTIHEIYRIPSFLLHARAQRNRKVQP